MLTLGFVKVTQGYVKKAESKPCLFILNKLIIKRLNEPAVVISSL
jgi:hypothetical protein